MITDLWTLRKYNLLEGGTKSSKCQQWTVNSQVSLVIETCLEITWKYLQSIQNQILYFNHLLNMKTFKSPQSPSPGYLKFSKGFKCQTQKSYMSKKIPWIKKNSRKCTPVLCFPLQFCDFITKCGWGLRYTQSLSEIQGNRKIHHYIYPNICVVYKRMEINKNIFVFTQRFRD